MRIRVQLAAALFVLVSAAAAGAAEVALQIPVTVTVKLAPGKYHFRFVLYRTTNLSDPDATAWMETMDTAGPKRTLSSNKLTHLLGSLDPVDHALYPWLFGEQLWLQVQYYKPKTAAWVPCSQLLQLAVVPYAIWSASSSQPVCFAGDFVGCYDGAPGTAGVGPCKKGLRTCTDAGSWQQGCAGEVVPQEEFCNGIDDDCDHVVDEGSTICPEAGQVCFEGSCQECATIPEVCDGLDNDCDLEVDEGDLCPPGMACVQGMCEPGP